MESLRCYALHIELGPGKACAGPITNNETPNRNQSDLVASSKMKQKNKINQISNETGMANGAYWPSLCYAACCTPDTLLLT